VREYGLKTDPDITGLTVIATNVEQEFCVPIPFQTGEFVGRIDGLCRDSDGRVWVIDHKTYSQLPGMLSHNLQTLGYTWAVQQLSDAGVLAPVGVTQGTRIYGALYNGLRKQRPGPRVTVPLFHREFIMRRPIELTNTMLSQVHSEMVTHPFIYPTFSNECAWCSFNVPCSAAQNDDDEEWLLASTYTAKPPRGETYTQPTLEEQL
jgi:hypothetical protein